MATGRVRLLFDENISHRLVDFLHRESRLAEMHHLRTLGWSGEKDAEWIPLAVSSEFVLITGDRNEMTRGIIIDDLKQMGARVILLGQFWDHLPRWERAKWLVQHIEIIVNLAGSMDSGSAVLLHKRGRKVLL